MTLAGFFYVLALVSVGATLTALVRARTLFFLSPLYFLVAWLTGELALHHIAWQLVFTLFCVTAGVLETSDGQWGLALFVLNWILLWRLHNVAAMTTPRVFQNALEQGLGADFRDTCGQHDRCYSHPCASRATCDQAFLESLLADCERSWNPKVNAGSLPSVAR